MGGDAVEPLNVIVRSGNDTKANIKKFGYVIQGYADLKLEDYIEAIVKVIPAESINSCGYVRSNIGLWLQTEEASQLLKIQNLLEVNGRSVQIWPYYNPIKQVKLLHVPPFIENDMLTKELSKYGNVKTVIKTEPLYLPSGKYKGINSFTITVGMSFKRDQRLPDQIEIADDIEQFTITTQVGKRKCFLCKSTTHVSRDCQNRKSYATMVSQTQPNNVHTERPSQELIIDTPNHEPMETPETTTARNTPTTTLEFKLDGWKTIKSKRRVATSPSFTLKSNKRIMRTSTDNTENDWGFSTWKDSIFCAGKAPLKNE
ncbi:unnamed protein product [Allacma fusca]|uniref:CCHC-type domain-containing protein n=1 Tax=Allacma fusca TaxID=39272 RepID=A0A8J2JE34_9HEXA|nr:unnamed protein product [Allacma fusca]